MLFCGKRRKAVAVGEVADCIAEGLETAYQHGEPETKFDIFITSDQNLRYHQNLAGRCLAILELSTNDLRRILAASSDIVAAVATTGAGEYRHLEIP